MPYGANLPKKCEKFQYVANESASCLVDSFNRSVIENCDNFIYEDDELTIQNEVGKTFPK